MKRINAKKITGFVLKFAVAVVVLAFLGLHSINFFMFVFPADQEYYAWLGFGLTGGGAVAYLVVFLWEADTVLRKWIALAIALVSGAGEIITALFGMRVEAWTRAGFAMTESDFDYMLLAVGLLALAHAAALAGYFAGDQIAEMFGDEDGDGIPNYRDKDYKVKNKGSNNPQQAYKSLGMYNPNDPSDSPFERSRPDVHKVLTENHARSNGHAPLAQPIMRQYSLDQLLAAIGMDKQEFKAFLIETDTYSMARKVLKDDGKFPADCSRKNFEELASKVNPMVGQGR